MLEAKMTEQENLLKSMGKFSSITGTDSALKGFMDALRV